MTIDYLIDNDVFLAAIATGHPNHKPARAWLDKSKAKGWGIALETYLAALRLLTNHAAMQGFAHTAEQALNVVEAEVGGNHPGKIVFAKEKPRRDIIARASGHKQVMDYWLIQLAKQEGAKLATFDGGTLANWPDATVGV